MSTEPALIRTAIVTVVGQIISVGVSLGLLHLAPEQIVTVNTAVALVSAAVAALWVRSGVTPVANVEEIPEPEPVPAAPVAPVTAPAPTAEPEIHEPAPVVQNRIIPDAAWDADNQ